MLDEVPGEGPPLVRMAEPEPVEGVHHHPIHLAGLHHLQQLLKRLALLRFVTAARVFQNRDGRQSMTLEPELDITVLAGGLLLLRADAHVANSSIALRSPVAHRSLL